MRPQVLVQAGAYVKEEICRALVVLLTNATALHGYAARAAYRALCDNLEDASLSLLTVSTWLLGTYHYLPSRVSDVGFGAGGCIAWPAHCPALWALRDFGSLADWVLGTIQSKQEVWVQVSTASCWWAVGEPCSRGRSPSLCHPPIWSVCWRQS